MSSASTTSTFTLPDLLRSVLPEDTLRTVAPYVQSYILADSSPVQIVNRRLISILTPLMESLYPIFQPVLATIATILDDPEGFANIAIAIGAVAAIFLIVSSILRTLTWFARATMRLAYYAVLVALAAMVYQRGVLVCARDAIAFVQSAVNYSVLIKDFFLAEYDRYDQQYQRQHAQVRSTYQRGKNS